MTRTYNTSTGARKECAEYGSKRDNPLATWGGNYSNDVSGFGNRGTRANWKHKALIGYVESGVPLHTAKLFAHLSHLSDQEAEAIIIGSQLIEPQVAKDDDL